LLNLEVEAKSVRMTQCADEQSWLPLTQYTIEERSVRVTQCVIEASSIPIAQFGNEQKSTPMPQCGVEAKNRVPRVINPALEQATSSMGTFRVQRAEPGNAYQEIKRSFPQRLQK
jgi:hypothetical protein